MDFTEDLNKDKLEKGVKEQLTDEEASNHRQWLEKRLGVANIALDHAWRVGKVMKDVVLALDEDEHAEVIRGRLFDL